MERVRCFCLGISEGSCINPFQEVVGPRLFRQKILKFKCEPLEGVGACIASPPHPRQKYLKNAIESIFFRGKVTLGQV